MVRISVIVPVFNPGRYIDELIQAVLAQSLPTSEYEVIFVDDGSTDGTAERLDQLEKGHANVKVRHQPNSGRPGRPRNVGTDLARGEYVFYADNDDWLARDALERLVRRADRDQADVVVGKVVGHGRTVPLQLFAASGRELSLAWAPLLQLLTPHKLFRRSFLNANGIRFPEGRRGLEDHAFVMQAYLATQRISVLADRPCYHWALRSADANASAAPFDPEHYFAGVRDVLDIVDAGADSESDRHRLLAHWYRSKVLRQLHGRTVARRDPDHNAHVFEAVRQLAHERFPPAVEQHLSVADRARSWLVRGGHLEGLVALAGFERQLRARVRPVELAVPRMRIEGRLRGGGGIRFQRVENGWAWRPPPQLAPHLGGMDASTATPAELCAVVRHEASNVEYLLPASTSLRSGAGVATVTASVGVDATTAAAGGPLLGDGWSFRFEVRLGGFSAVARRVAILGPEGQTTGRGRLLLRMPGNGGPAVLSLEGC